MSKPRLHGLVFALFFLIQYAPAALAHAPVLGPKTYTRSTGAPNVFSEIFSPSSLQGTFTLIVTNGDGNGNRRVNSGSIVLNGVEVVKEKDFSQASIQKIINVQSNNSLTIQLKGGTPDSFITVSIVRHIDEHDGPVISIEQPQPGQTFDSSPITVSGKVTDVSGVAELKVNGVVTPVVNDAFTTQVALTQGSNTITVQAKDFENNTSQLSLEVFLSTAKILSVNPNTGQSGQTLSVTITGQNTHFVQGSTQANFGSGISVGGAAAGEFGAVNVVSPTSATAQLQISTSATAGPRTVTLKTNQEEASLAQGFTVVAIVPPTISDFTPKSGPIGTLVTVAGTNFSQGGIGPQVTLNKQGGGTIAAPVSSVTATSLTFVVPAGAATGPLAIAVGAQSATSADALTIVASSDFELAVAPGIIDVIQGQSGSFALTLNSNNGFTQLSTLSVSGLPSGVTASFKPQQITAGQGSVLTITVPADQSLGSANLVLSAKATVDGIELTSSTNATLNIKPITTSFLGRTVVADTLETPLAGVTVRFVGKNSNGNPTNCSSQTVSDAAGNFSFTDLPAGCVGEQLIRYDGLTATAPAGRYAGVDLVYNIVANQVTVSPVLVHLPRIDDKETVMVEQNANQDQTFEFKTVPGLAVTVYAGTKFTLVDGTQPNPFPLTAVQVATDRLPDAKPPVPGMMMVFIVAFQPANATASQPVAVYFPNTVNTPPGTNMVLMTLDPTKGTMVPYGTGTVANDGSNVVPDFDPAHPGKRFGLVHFDWHGQMPPPGPSVNPSPDGSCGPQEGKPIDISSGVEVVTQTDIAIKGGRGSISIDRTYRSLSTVAGPFGVGTSHNYEYRLDTTQPQNSATLNLIMPDGNRFSLVRQANGTLINSTIPSLQGAVMTTAPDGTASLRWKDGVVFRFVPGTFLLGSVLQSIVDPNGNTILLTRNSSQPAQISEVVDPVGRKLVLTYDFANRITSVVDPIGRMVRYTYNTQGTLQTVTDPEGGITRYDYDVQNRLIRVTDARGIIIARNTYDANGRVIEQERADGGKLSFVYTLVNPLAPTSPVLQTIVTDPLGNQTTYRFNTQGFLVGVTDAIGQTRIFERQAGTNLLLSVTGPAACMVCGAVAAGDRFYSYDVFGNLLSIKDALGNITTFTYEPSFNKISSITDASGKVIRFTYDGKGNLLSRTDENGNITSMTYDSSGLPIQIIDPLDNKVTLSYDSAGNLVSVKDPLGNAASFRRDGAARIIEVIDSLGKKTVTNYDALDRVVKRINEKNDAMDFSFDAVGNVLSITDQRNNKTIFTYDQLGRLATRTTPLGKIETYKYDLTGNLVEFIDRKGQKSIFEHDQLGRVIKETYSDGSIVTYGYDAFSRPTSVADSVSGAYTFKYDSGGRLVDAANQNGSILYTYDPLGRVLTRTVVGDKTVSYTYDGIGNLLKASSSEASVTFSYDAGNRLTKIERSNSVASIYSFDALGRVVRLIHGDSSTSLNEQIYTYNAKGLRTEYRTNVAQPLTTSAATSDFNSANQLLRRGQTTYTYDDNGNRTTEVGPLGTTRYEWDARNRLHSITEPTGRSLVFTYDFQDNLISQKTVGTGIDVTENFLLDDLTNVVGFSKSSGEKYSILTGRTIDQHLAIVQNGEAKFSLQDVLNSTIATTDAAASINDRYFYEPYGETTVAGTASPFQFTGRFPVGNLYYHRSRFYDPVAGRFLSEDSIGFTGAEVNLYRYAQNNPAFFVDPNGEWVWIAAGAVVGAAINVGITYVANDGNVTWRQVGAAALSGAISGSIGALAGPLGGTIATGLGASATGFVAAIGTAGVSALGGAAAQAAANAVDPCHASSIANAALFGGIGGGVATFVPVRGVSTLNQARYFAPRTFGGLFRSGNSRLLVGSYGLSSGVGAASSFGGPFR